jgi:hypothetical protein
MGPGDQAQPGQAAEFAPDRFRMHIQDFTDFRFTSWLIHPEHEDQDYGFTLYRSEE